MSELNVMVGIPASGKDYYIKTHKKFDDVVVSSDEIRKELYGDENIQGDPNEVFSIVLKRVKEGLQKDKTVWYNATNVTRKSRHAGLDIGMRYADRVRAYIMATPVEQCIYNDERRNKKVGADVIKSFLCRFMIPMKEEGFTDIYIIRNFPQKNFDSCKNDILEEMRGFSQISKYHTEDLYTHSVNVFRQAKSVENRFVRLCCLFHDYGKLFTRTVDDEGNTHFYSHENVGTYRLLTDYHYLCTDEDLLKGLFVVNYHMLPHKWRESEKAKLQFERQYGREKTEFLETFRKWDLNASVRI